jgi:hypothetical protein
MYTLAFSDEALEELGLIDSPMERRKALAAIQCLTTIPESLGCGEAVDVQGRTSRIAVLGGLAFVFWADHTFRKLRILAIKQVGDPE